MINAILVPLRNAAHLTRRAHLTFAAQDCDPAPEILYIDNASTDNTPQMLAGWDCHVLRNSAPKSVARSWNQGLKWWFKQGAEYVLVCNNDVELRPDTYRWLLKAGGLFVTAVGSDSVEAIAPPYNPPDLTSVRYNPDFSCFLLHRKLWDMVGPFDESYLGAYGEDASYDIKMRTAGVLAYCISIPFYHVASGTLKHSTPKEQAVICRQADSNRTTFFNQFGVQIGSSEYYALLEKLCPSVPVCGNESIEEKGYLIDYQKDRD